MSVAQSVGSGKRARPAQEDKVKTTPSTRLCIKNLDERFTEDQLRETITRDTGKGSKQLKGLTIDITDLKILRNDRGKSRRIAVLGVKTIEQATAIQKYWHRAYIGKSIVTVEYHTTNAQKWSKHAEGSLNHAETLRKREEASQYRQERVAALLLGLKRPRDPTSISGNLTNSRNEDAILTFGSITDDEEKKQKILKALEYHPALLGLSDDEKLDVVKNPIFHDYISSSLQRASKSGRLWDNDDTTGKTNILRAVYQVLNAGNATTDGNNQSAASSTGDSIHVRGKSSTTQEQSSTKGKMNDHDDDHAQLATYEELIKKIQRTAGKEDADDDSDDYFSNPGLSADNDDDDDNKSDTIDDNSSKNKKTTDKKKSAMSDQDFLKMAMGSFSSDDDDDGDSDDDDENDTDNGSDDDEDDDDDNENTDADSSTNKTRTSQVKEDDPDGEDDDDGNDNEDDDQTNAVKKQRTQSGDDDNSNDNDLVTLSSEDEHEHKVMQNGSIFIRNLPYTTTEDDIIELCSDYGQLAGVDFAVDLNNQSKGYCTVYYQINEQAVTAYHALSRHIFQGRTLHVIPGKTSASARASLLDKLGDDDLKNMTYKRKQELEKQVNAMKTTQNWNSLFISPDTVANAIAAKFNMKKSELLTSDDAATEQHSGAVRLAVAETHIIAETKAFLEDYGVILDKFTSSPHDKLKGNTLHASDDKYSQQIILVKNIPFDTEEKELRKVFTRYGNLGRVILPPYKTIAIIEYLSIVNARNAFQNLAYKRFKSMPLYLEWAPANCLKSAEQTGYKGALIAVDDDKKRADKAANPEDSTAKTSGDGDDDDTNLAVPTVFVKNINFTTTDEQLKQKITSLLSNVIEYYRSTAPPSTSKSSNIQDSTLWTIRHCVIMKRTVQNKTGADKNRELGDVLSLGYGFIEFTSPICATYFIKYIQSILKHQPTLITLDSHILSFRLTTPQDNANQLTQESLKMKTILREKGIISYEQTKLQEAWSKNNNKIIVRNIPFEANIREVKEIFKSFAQVKRCTLPRKNGSSQTKGYAFVEFVTPDEAQKAFQALQHTHIFGRRMVMEWAKPDDTVEDLRVKAQQQLKQSRA